MTTPGKRSSPGKKHSARFRNRYSPIGIDIGSALIKAVQFSQTRGRVSLHCRAVVPTPGETFRDGAVIDPAPLAEALAKLRRKHRWHKNRAVFGLGAQFFYLRKALLPYMTGSELEKAMFWEVEKQFPLSAKTAVFSYCPAEPFNGKKQPRQYLLAAAAKETSAAYTDAAARAGFFCVSLDVLPLALLRSVQFNSRFRSDQGPEIDSLSKPEPRALLDIGFKDSAILVSTENRYRFYRNIKTGTDHFCRALEEKVESGEPSALRRLYAGRSLREKGLLETADRFAERIGQSLAYWADQPDQRDHVLRGIEFCGGGAFIPGLAARIEQKLALKRLLYNPLAPFTGSSPEKQAARFREEVLFTAAHGLALRGWLK